MDRLAGRDRELARLRHLLDEVTGGSPRALMVHGEAGVGKTRLVRAALSGRDLAVAWGTCVHFGASTLPFAPLVSALRPWLHDADGDLEAARLIPVVERTLHRLAGERTTVLVVDDLQWADASSLDALAYVMAGFRDERLALIATCRDEDRPVGAMLHGWLEDVRRMPGFEEMRLGRLDPAAVEDLVASHFGGPVDLGLVADIYERSGGNTYLAELLVRDLPQGATRLPRSAPAALTQALTARWHALSGSARTVVQILAVGGRPRSADLLTRVAGMHGVGAAEVEHALAEGTDNGVVVAEAASVWFRHPLLAEVLEAAVAPTFASRVHASYAAMLQEQHDVPERRRADDLAMHHLLAGQLSDAFDWSLRAADAAAEADSVSEAVHLERACALWQDLPDRLRPDAAAHVGLLCRTSRVDERAGRIAAAVAHVEQARLLVSPTEDPLQASRLLSRWCDLVWQRDAPGRAVRPERFEALRMVESYPDSPERAQALTGLAEAFDWDGSMAEALGWAERAVSVARRCGSEDMLVDALIALTRVTDDLDDGLARVVEAHELARRMGDGERMTSAAIWRANTLEALGREREAMTFAREAVEEGLASGSVAWSHFLAGLAAHAALRLGEWPEARRLLRRSLAARPTAIPGAIVHLVAAQHAVLVGEPAAARAHLDRAQSLVPEFFVGLAEVMAPTQLLVLVAEGDPGRALRWFEALRSRVPSRQSPAVEPVKDHEFLAWTATASAELAEAARDRGDTTAAAATAAHLESLVATVGVPDLSELPTPAAQHQLRLFEAELARCRRAPDEERRWAVAAAAAADAERPWHQAYARWREAQAGVRAKASRARLGETLREAHRIAAGLGARPLLASIVELAVSARILLADAETPGPRGAAEPGGPLEDLTPREREILGHLVAGRSNGEIGRDLVISEKTVSVHVSNILRKTGTAGRVEAAALARRLG